MSGNRNPVKMEIMPSTGISVLIVGAGLVGLAAAIECHRQGHTIRIIERAQVLESLGDGIAMGTSSLHTPAKWPGFMERIQNYRLSKEFRIYKSTGQLIYKLEPNSTDGPSFPVSRANLHRLLQEYVEDIGLHVELGTEVASYYDTETSGGVWLQDGTKIEADVVLAADGVGTTSWKLITGMKNKAISSGFAIYRCVYPVELALADPVIAKEYEGVESRVSVHLGNNSHCVVAMNRSEISMMLTYMDDGNATENWANTQSKEKAIKCAEGWYLVENVARAIPGTVIDWKLMWRNPQEKWVSPLGRVVQVGDSAHSFLPTSASGATMGFEDAFSVAVCLKLAGKKDIPTALRAHNKMRFERVTCAQKMGFKTRENFHHTDWEAVEKNPKIAVNIVGNWVLQHDPEKYAYDNYQDAARHVVEGTPFTNTNSVPGHTFKPWTINELLKMSQQGEVAVDDGDWS